MRVLTQHILFLHGGMSIGKSVAKALSTKTFKDITQFGDVFIKGSRLSTSLISVDPHTVPNGDEAVLSVANDSLLNVVKFVYKNGVLSVDAQDTQCDIQVSIPHNYNIHADVERLNVQSCEGQVLNVETKGDCELGKINAENSKINCGANLNCKTLLSNASIKCGGSVDIGKIQTHDLNIETLDGNIHISDLYSQNAALKTEGGKVYVNNVNGRVGISTKDGDVCVSSLSGDLNVDTHSGDVSATIEQCQNVNICTVDGFVEMGISDSLHSAFIEAKGTSINLPEDLLFDGVKQHDSSGQQSFEGKIGDGQAGDICVLSTNGDVEFSQKSWFTNLELED